MWHKQTILWLGGRIAPAIQHVQVLEKLVLPIVAQEDGECEQSGRYAQGRKNQWNYSPRTIPSQMLGWDLVTSVVVSIGSVAGRAGHASVVKWIAIFTTRDATPTALILCLDIITNRERDRYRYGYGYGNSDDGELPVLKRIRYRIMLHITKP